HPHRCRGGRHRDPRGLASGMGFPARLAIPETVVRIAQKLETAGYETWCVGGAIRDNLLGLENHDFDPTTAAPPEEVRRLVKGAADLAKKLIRSVGDANWRFQEDYLRILRALRFSARFDFRIHGGTLEAAKANVQGLSQLSAERVREEWFKGIRTAGRVSKLLALWIDVGAARIWLPEIGGKRDEGRGKSPVDTLPRDPVLIT